MALPGQALHAVQLGLDHPDQPASGLVLQAPLPEVFEQACSAQLRRPDAVGSLDTPPPGCA
jgi:hypothetical protein